MIDRAYKAFLKRSEKQEKKEQEECYPDYSDIRRFVFVSSNMSYFLVSNKTKEGKELFTKMTSKEELLKIGISEDYLLKLEYNYYLLKKNEKIKTKLFSKNKKPKIRFNLKSNIEEKEYSDAFTIIEDLRKKNDFITINKILQNNNDSFKYDYFNTKDIIKLRAAIISGKKDKVFKIDEKIKNYNNEKYLTKKDLGKIRRSELCTYRIKKET